MQNIQLNNCREQLHGDGEGSTRIPNRLLRMVFNYMDHPFDSQVW